MVSARTLLGAGLALIAIMSLAAVVIVQQMTIQRISAQTGYVRQPQLFTNYVTQYQPFTVSETITQQLQTMVSTQAANRTSDPYVLITYFGETYSPIGIGSFCPYTPTAASGYTFLAVKITVKNNGYDSVFVSEGGFLVVVNNQEYQISSGTGTCIGGSIPGVSLSNGSSTTGWLLYVVPANYGTFTLIWEHSSNINVQYVHLNL